MQIDSTTAKTDLIIWLLYIYIKTSPLKLRTAWKYVYSIRTNDLFSVLLIMTSLETKQTEFPLNNVV